LHASTEAQTPKIGCSQFAFEERFVFQAIYLWLNGKLGKLNALMAEATCCVMMEALELMCCDCVAQTKDSLI
jgi:hypothetical protein